MQVQLRHRMKQNKYDDPEFFARYGAMARSTGGLAAAGEWPALRAMLPPLGRARVLDLGCGFGWHARHARAQGAARVVGVDISQKMLARAAELDTQAGIDGIEYRRMAIEDATPALGTFDIVLSSLALHYVADLAPVFANAFALLAPGGAFVFSMEHPVFTARAEQDWHTGPGGARLHWPVDGYQDEGIRRTRWLADDVVKYHRTTATILNGVIGAGFRIARVAEPAPGPEMVALSGEMRDERRRPMFLLVAAHR